MLCALLSMTTIAGGAAAQQHVVRPADPVKRGVREIDFPRTVKVADNVYTYEDYHPGDEKFTTTSLFVVTHEGVLVADGQATAAATKGRGVTYIIHPTSKRILDRSAEASRSGASVWRLPDNAITLADKQSFRLGGQEFDVMFLGRSHTGGDLAVWLPQRKILFLSEIFLNRVFPAMRSAYPSEWSTALDRAEAMKADLYVAGHGFTETGPVSHEELTAYHQALRAVIAEARRLHDAGVPVDEAIGKADFGEYASWTLSTSQGPIAVRKVYEELDGKLR